ncbi:hypothetical protein [Haladaptatus cibarius]|uniref:hypothetical protein n=1 Tax=Haladaptatus cibarius TaxID=453847 RepID=UPI000678EB61|nr:hypothetical protein [Haladaptatus cibarius]
MSSDNAPARHIFGHIHVVSTSVLGQLLGLVLAFVAFSIIDWAIDPLTTSTGTVLYGTIGVFILCNGLYVGGLRVR